jgi:transcription-repair coupling factor (superfamily II helicase)
MTFDMSQLLSLAAEMPVYHQLKEVLLAPEKKQKIVLLNAAKPYFIAALYRDCRRPMLVVTAQPENSRKLHEQTSLWLNSPVKLYPEPDTLPYERVISDAVVELERIQVLSALANCDRNEPTAIAHLVITSAPALMSRVPLCEDFVGRCLNLEQGMEIEPFHLLRQWETMGYRMENIVEIPGTMSHRGGIIDIYPPTSELPVRFEFFGNTIDNIRLFDPATQRSVGPASTVSIGPATELLSPRQATKNELERILQSIDLSGCNVETREQIQQEMAMLVEGQEVPNRQFYAPLFNRASLLDYLPGNTLLLLDELADIEHTIAELHDEAEQMRMAKLSRGELPCNFPRPYATWDEMAPLVKDKQSLRLTSWGSEEEMPRLNFAAIAGYAGQVPAFITKIRQLLGQKRRVILVSHQASRLSELLEEADIIASPLTEVKQVPLPGSLTLVQGSLAEGWVMGNDTCLFTDAEIFGFVKQRREVKKHPVRHQKLFVDISPGDFVVHVEHGIARFSDVTTLRTDGNEKEYLVLRYAAGDKLYVPNDQIDRVSRYIGAGDRTPVLSRLGTQEWTRTKQRAKEAAEELAQELLALYASREVVPGVAFSRDTVWQQELEASFPYMETADQLEAQREVKEDMEKARPMDRLVCGDVGYGKTEVAVRAAFKTVMDNKQVAVLVPTTVLAQQHQVTFSQRMEAFPVKIEVLSRFKSPKEQRAIIEGLAEGRVDICIGTHRLLQKDIAVKDLGLLIIDEEQRFGVAHKEYLKKMRKEVDVLTLSATPIPRTLHMSLVGVRDMSTMETPPEARLPIKTYVAEYNDLLVREAILRELERNGQVFFVHNRVQSIALVADKLKELVPEAEIAVGHGRMSEDDLETVMTDFSRGKSDVLVCTTIIESGLDMPNVNTVIISQADKFGLTQLYQLRGRVGRGTNLAYAYFLYEKGKHLTPTAQQRLRTIYQATELGAGFNIAMKDLEIRGAGTLLGTRQSGYISAVGFSLYCRLLAEAVEAQKARLAGARETVAGPSSLPPPSVNLPLTARIPEEYVPDIETRLGLYRKLIKLETEAQVETLAQEFEDRFGPLPVEVNNLLYAVKIKLLAARAGIESISTEHGQIILRRFEGMPFDKQKLGSVLKDGITAGVLRLAINPKRFGEEWQKVLEEVLESGVIQLYNTDNPEKISRD